MIAGSLASIAADFPPVPFDRWIVKGVIAEDERTS